MIQKVLTHKFSLSLTIIITLCITSLFCVSNVNGLFDKSFYRNQGITLYDPRGCAIDGTGTKNLVGNDNTEKALRYFIGQGLTLAQASGIIGNLMAESGVNPTSIQPSGSKPADKDYSPVDGTGFGIAQWTFTGRQEGLVNLSKSSKRDIIDLSLQLDYMWQELNSTKKDALAALKLISDPVEAAVTFHNIYEGSADSSDKVITVRGGNASDIYNKYKDSIPDSTTGIKTGNITCTGNGSASAFIDGFAVYNQNDPQWNDTIYGGTTTIGEAGCGPSAMAMIVTALTGSTVTPVDTAIYGAKNGTFVDGQGSSHTIAKVIGDHWGLKSSGVSANEAKVNEILRDGGLILAVATGNAPYTSFGHFIVIRAVNSNGKWLIGDSNGQAGIKNSSAEWDPSTILDGGQKGVNMWAITK